VGEAALDQASAVDDRLRLGRALPGRDPRRHHDRGERVPAGSSIRGVHRPGSYFGSPHSSGLGFGLGAALGVKLARRGDGHRHRWRRRLLLRRAALLPLRAARAPVPILTVVFNNQQWEAVEVGTSAVHPAGRPGRAAASR
jgi:hypothetical protein